MEQNRNAFTLIEMLVVVLIIGILAAVTVPQYQKAVIKSKYIQLMAFGNAIAKAANAYYLENGIYPARFDELAIDLPLRGTDGNLGHGKGTKKTYQDYTCEISSGMTDRADAVVCHLTISGKRLSYRQKYQSARWTCMATTTWDLGNKICQNMTGKTKTETYYGEQSEAQAVYEFE